MNKLKNQNIEIVNEKNQKPKITNIVHNVLR